MCCGVVLISPAVFASTTREVPLPLAQNIIKLQIKASKIKYTMFNLIDETRIVSFLKGHHKLQTTWHEVRTVSGG